MGVIGINVITKIMETAKLHELALQKIRVIEFEVSDVTGCRNAKVFQ